jgi:Domain of unknown function (DUF4281)
MSPDSLFTICNAISLVAWLIIVIVSPFWFDFDKFVVGIIITLFTLIYAWLIIAYFNFRSTGDFSSLDSLMVLFSDKRMVLAGWVHYLAFDLMTGVWIKKNSVKHGISHAAIIPCFLFTFMLGPLGLLIYFLVRWAKTKRFFQENY